MMPDTNRIKDYWMATMAGDEPREWWEQTVWNTEEGLNDLADWFEEELAMGLTEDEMDEAIKMAI